MSVESPRSQSRATDIRRSVYKWLPLMFLPSPDFFFLCFIIPPTLPSPLSTVLFCDPCPSPLPQNVAAKLLVSRRRLPTSSPGPPPPTRVCSVPLQSSLSVFWHRFRWQVQRQTTKRRARACASVKSTANETKTLSRQEALSWRPRGYISKRNRSKKKKVMFASKFHLILFFNN